MQLTAASLTRSASWRRHTPERSALTLVFSNTDAVNEHAVMFVRDVQQRLN